MSPICRKVSPNLGYNVDEKHNALFQSTKATVKRLARQQLQKKIQSYFSYEISFFQRV